MVSQSVDGDDATIVQSAPIDDRTLVRAAADDDPTAVPGSEEPTVGAVGANVSDETGSGPLRVGQNFGPRYHIIKALGIGGMGAVYQAWDAELGEAVAIKVIRREVMRDRVAAAELEKRFKRELLLARLVTHKNVVRIHDLGEIDGIKYITMSYVDGIDLSTLIKQEGTLGIARAVRITRSIVEGLLAAHAVGVVHRDLKPANIMVRGESEALIMDFGIARATQVDQTMPLSLKETVAALPVDLRHTATRYTDQTTIGAVVGTVHYMAPEQGRGEEVDQRADIYALGLIIYDMILGKHRTQTTDSAIAELQSRMERAPAPLQTLAPAVPAPLNDLVARCLEPDRTRRFPTTQALADALARLDDAGHLRPVRRVIGLPLMAVVVLLLLAVSVGTWWYQRQFIPAATHEPVSVLIADLRNNTNDATFDRTLEPMLKRALEGAGFITAYDHNGLRGLGVRPRPTLDEAGAREIAVQQGLTVVLSGAIDSDRRGLRISVKATQAVTDTTLATEQGYAANKDDVVDVATRLMTGVRSALGDDKSESQQQFAMGSLSATSLDVVRLYSRAMEAQSGNRFDEARKLASEAVALDPNFGIGYLILAVSSRNLGRMDDNQRFLEQALSHLDGMTERERYQTRGYSYWSSGDYEQCVKEFGDLIARYPGDVGGRNQLALCLSNLREMRRAMDEIREIVKILPSHPLFRDNLALYANYAGDFDTAEQEARAVGGTDAYARLALAFAQLGKGQLAEAQGTYESLRELGEQGASFAASGLGDLAIVQGRYADAVKILESGAADDAAKKNTDAAAAKLVAAAYAEVSRGRSRQAIAAAEKALALSTLVKIRFLAARTMIEAGALDKAPPHIAELAKDLYAEPRAYAKVLEGQIAAAEGDPRRAMTLLREANDLFDTWIGFFELGRASLAAGAYAQADSAFDVCLNARRGEALALFVDEEPTYGYLPQAHYYQGLVRDGLKSAGAAQSFREYLSFRGASSEDPLVPKARERAGP